MIFDRYHWWGVFINFLAKVLANGLRQVIGSVVSEPQSAFVKNRQILDGISIVNEMVDEAQKFKKKKTYVVQSEF